MERDINEGIKVFGITSDSEAADYFKKINEVKKEIKEKEEFKLNEISKIEKWFLTETKYLNELLEHYQSELIAYYIAKRRDNPKARVSTPWGKVQSRKTKKWAYDEQIVIDYMREYAPEMIRVKEELDKATIKKEFKDGVNIYTGEVIPGVTITEEESISVKGDE